MNKTVNVPVCIFSKASIHTVFYKQRRNTYINIWVGWWEGHKRLLHRAA